MRLTLEASMRLSPVRTILVAAFLVATARPASADATVFLGTMTLGGPRTVKGASFGHCLSMICLELEYAGTSGAPTPASSSAYSGSANLMVQSTRAVRGFRFYGTGGLGLYGETLNNGSGSGEVLAKNVGGGAKVGLAGPFHLRLDYRVFIPGDAPDASRGMVIHRHPQRFTTGVGMSF